MAKNKRRKKRDYWEGLSTKACHIDGKEVLVIKEGHICAGSKSTPGAYDARISLGTEHEEQGIMDLWYGAEALFKNAQQFTTTPPPTLRLDWRDQDAPALALGFWKALYKDLGKIKGQCLVHCMGGHGRTGTGLSILLWLNGYTGDPVEYLRKNYCEKAVESETQIEYLKELGVPTTMKAYWKAYTWTGKGTPFDTNQNWLEGGVGNPVYGRAFDDAKVAKDIDKSDQHLLTVYDGRTEGVRCIVCGIRKSIDNMGQFFKSAGDGVCISCLAVTSARAKEAHQERGNKWWWY